MSVYVAGSSDEIDRVDAWSLRLAKAGVNVTSNWTANIKAVGVANPRSATHQDRSRWALSCITGVALCKVLWVMAPSSGHGRGAYFELGYARGCGKRITVSGDTTQSIFGSVGREFLTDADAFAAIMEGDV